MYSAYVGIIYKNYINKLMITLFWHFHFDDWIGENVLGCATQINSVYGKH